MKPMSDRSSPWQPCASERRIGAAWARALARGGLPPDGRVVEVGPGFTLKVALGLRDHGFRGELFVVEPNSWAREWTRWRYRALLPRARIVPVGHPLASAARWLPPSVDAVVMNHLLDDLVLDAALEPARREVVFRAMRPGAVCLDEVTQVWHRLRKDPAAFRAIGDRIVRELCAFYSVLDPGLLALTQYPSWFHRHHHLGFVDRLLWPLMRRLAAELVRAGAACALTGAGAGQDEPRWLTARRAFRANGWPHGQAGLLGEAHSTGR